MNAMAISFWCSLVIFLCGSGLFAWLYFRKKPGKAALTITAVATIGLSLIALRVFHFAQTGISFPEQLIVSAMDSIRYFAMGKTFSEIDDLTPDQIFQAYYTMEIFLSLLAPLCTATVLASVLRTILSQIRLTLNHSCPVYYFSELNERSLTLVKALLGPKAGRSGKKTKIIFCKAHDSNMMRAEAHALGALTVSEPIHLIRLPDPTARQVRVFLIDNDEERNIQNFLKMHSQLCIPGLDRSKDLPESDFLVFSTQESAELVFDETLALLDKDTLAYDLRLINETRQVTQQLLLDHPLYEAAEESGSSRISVLVVGCGYLGTQVIKNAMVCGMMDNYDVTIQVIDDKAQRLEQQFLHEHPFLEKPSRVLPGAHGDKSRPALAPVFHQANVCTNSFDAVLKEHCTHSNYIVVATGDDQLNITTAQYLRRWYTRRVLCENEGSNVNPLIFAAVRSPERYTGMKALEETNRAGSGFCGKLFLFANNMELYSTRQILDRPLDAAAAMLNSCYSDVRKAYDTRKLLDWDENARRAGKQSLLRLTVMSQRSNQLAALHSLYKLQDLLHWSKQAGLEKDETCFSLTRCAAGDPTHTFFRLARLMDKRGYLLHDLEHRRWTMFQALNGWDLYPHDRLFALLKQDPSQEKPHKNEAARLHGCMIPTNELDEFGARLTKATGISQDFKQTDEVMCLTSLFIWLDLAVDPQLAEKLLSDLRSHLTERDADKHMLDQLRSVGKKLDKAPQKIR